MGITYQGRIQEQRLGGHGERGARAYNKGLGLCPQRGLGAEPLVRGSGGEAS